MDFAVKNKPYEHLMGPDNETLVIDTMDGARKHQPAPGGVFETGRRCLAPGNVSGRLQVGRTALPHGGLVL
jgi:hypothetical protein